MTVITFMRCERSTGFTLIELLIAVAIAAVILGIGVPAMSTVIKNQRLSNTMDSVSRGLFLARSESIKSGKTVTLCARASDTQCGTSWNNGYLVFRDSSFTSTETQAQRDAGDEIIRVVQPFANGIGLSARGSSDGTVANAATANHLHYRPNGRSAWGAGTFFACDDRGNVNAKAINILASGEIKAERQADAGAAMQDVFDEDLSCI